MNFLSNSDAGVKVLIDTYFNEHVKPLLEEQQKKITELETINKEQQLNINRLDRNNKIKHIQTQILHTIIILKEMNPQDSSSGTNCFNNLHHCNEQNLHILSDIIKKNYLSIIDKQFQQLRTDNDINMDIDMLNMLLRQFWFKVKEWNKHPIHTNIPKYINYQSKYLYTLINIIETNINDLNKN